MKTQKILIVEDDVFSREAMEKILESHNYETSSCATAEEAVIKLQEGSFEILITDLRMGGMDGLELIKEARRIYPKISTILVTGFASGEIRLRAKEEGVDGFFPKPIEWDKLVGFLNPLPRTERDQNQDVDRNKEKKRHSSFQQKLFITFILSLLALFAIRSSEAQKPFPKLNTPNLRMDSQGTCWESSSLALTEAQKEALEPLRRSYMAETMPIRTELLALRIELRHLLSDPNVQSKLLFDRQKKISELQAKLDDLSLSYQIKARSILTKEQLEQLPPDFSMGMGTGFGMDIGIGRGPRKGIR